MSDTPRTDAECARQNNEGWSLPDIRKFGRQLERELAAVTEQRDELKSKYRTHHDEAERITNEIRRVSSVCHKLREQRDRLAEALKEIYNVSSFDYATMPELARKKYREVVLEMADEALAAVKGGSDE